MGEPVRDGVVGQLLGQVPVAQGLAERGAPPRPEVDLVDAQPIAHEVPPLAVGHPGRVSPLVVALEHDAGHAPGVLGEPGHRVGPLLPHAVDAHDLVLVRSPGPDALDDAAPHPGAVQPLERMVVTRPPRPRPDDVHALRARGPHREGGGGAAVDLGEVRPEHLPEPFVPALPEQPEVVGGGQVRGLLARGLLARGLLARGLLAGRRGGRARRCARERSSAGRLHEASDPSAGMPT